MSSGEISGEILYHLDASISLLSEMGSQPSKTATEQDNIDLLRAMLEQTRTLTATIEARIDHWEEKLQKKNAAASDTQQPVQNKPSVWPLQPDEYQRYGRQMIMPEIGLEGQLKLKRAKVLIVGVGGLGCPAAQYLAGAGVGVLGLVDDDTVSLSNLHRQILYMEQDVGQSKVEDAIYTLRSNNPKTEYRPYPVRLRPDKAIELFEQYDLILDCTDHPSSRYFISDAAVLAGKPLVTASGLRTEGQLMVLNHPAGSEEQRNFCYRCVFPKPPPPESVTTCGEGGILGPVVGVMGVLMAMEAMKILAPPPQPENQDPNSSTDTTPTLLMYSAYSKPLFRSVRLKGKRPDCIACSPHATITRETLESGSLDYIAFCGARTPTNLLLDEERIPPHAYFLLRQTPSPPHILIDVREPVEYKIAHIEGSINLPLSLITQNPDASSDQLEKKLDYTRASEGRELYLICRLGNDSQVAVQKLRNIPQYGEGKYEVKGDIKGGLAAWKRDVDWGFPDYGGFDV